MNQVRLVVLVMGLLSCTPKQVAELATELSHESEFGNFLNFNVAYSGAMDITSISQTDIRPTHMYYQSFSNLIERYGFGVEPLIIQTESGYTLREDDPITRENFFIILKKLILDNAQIEYELKAEKVFSCTDSTASSITGATIDDISSSNASFQAVQCLVDHGFSDKYGLIDSSSVRPGDLLTRAEMYVLIFEVLEALNAKMLPIKEKIYDTNSCIVNYRDDSLKAAIKTLFARISVFPSAYAQVTSITQFSDVKPTDPFYVPISLFIDKWGSLSGYPNGTLMGYQTATYGELVEILNASLDRFTETNDELKRRCREIEKENAIKSLGGS